MDALQLTIQVFNQFVINTLLSTQFFDLLLQNLHFCLQSLALQFQGSNNRFVGNLINKRFIPIQIKFPLSKHRSKLLRCKPRVIHPLDRKINQSNLMQEINYFKK